MITHDLGRLYLAAFSVEAGAPLLHRVTTHSYQPPYRWSRSLVLRWWPGHAIEVGWWRDRQNQFEDDVHALARPIRAQLPDRFNQNLALSKVHEYLQEVQQQEID